MYRVIFNIAQMILTLLILFLAGAAPAVIPAMIDRKTEGFETYTVDLLIGMPPTSYKLQVSFAHDTIILYEDHQTRSTQYDTRFGGSDVVHVDGKEVAVPVVLDPYRQIRVANTRCADCQGILGLSDMSVFWRAWPDMAFSRAGITLGDLHREFYLHNTNKNSLLHCEEDATDGHLCKTNVTVKIGERTFHTMLEIALTDQTMRLPGEIYDAYVHGRNMFKDDITKWPKMEIVAEHPDAENEHAIGYTHRLKNVVVSKKTIFHIDGKEMIIETPRRRIKAFDRADKGTPIRLGASFLRKFVLQKNALTNNLLLHAMLTSDKLPQANLYLIIVLIPLFVVWRLTNIAEFVLEKNTKVGKKVDIRWPALAAIVTWLIAEKRDLRNRPLNLFLEFAGIVLAICSYAILDSSRVILSTYPVVYILTGVMLGAAVLFKAFSFGVWITRRESSSISTIPDNFHARLMRAFSQEVILLTALWILLVARRIETLSTVLVFIVSTYAVFVAMFYALLIIHYYIVVGINGPYNEYFPYFVLYVLAVGGTMAAVGTQYFYPPFLVANTKTYKELIVPLTVFAFIVMAAFANYIATLYTFNWKQKKT